MNQVHIRQAKAQDIMTIREIEVRSWGEEMAASTEIIKERMVVYPEGNVVATLSDGTIVGYACFIKVGERQLQKPIVWSEITDAKRSHVDDGHVFYGVTLTGDPKHAKRNLGKHLLDYAKTITTESDMDSFMLGSRVPGYADWFSKEGGSLSKYLTCSHKGLPRDRELRMYSQFGFRLDQALPNYFEDPESLNNGALMVYDNPARV